MFSDVRNDFKIKILNIFFKIHQKNVGGIGSSSLKISFTFLYVVVINKKLQKSKGPVKNLTVTDCNLQIVTYNKTIVVRIANSGK